MTLKLGLILAASLVAAPAFAGQITVSGRGDVAMVPDMATITIGVAHQADSASEAVGMMSDAMSQVIEELTAAGIAPRQMQTSSLRVDRIDSYNNQTGKTVFEGFRASNRVTVQVLELDNLGSLLDVVFASGANDLGQLQFGVVDQSDALEAARRAAVADARAKAEIYADAAGVILGDLVSLTEGGARAAPVAMMEMARSADAVPIAQGEVTLNASVTMVYETE